jgi:hypothetical protein
MADFGQPLAGLGQFGLEGPSRITERISTGFWDVWICAFIYLDGLTTELGAAALANSYGGGKPCTDGGVNGLSPQVSSAHRRDSLGRNKCKNSRRRFSAARVDRGNRGWKGGRAMDNAALPWDYEHPEFISVGGGAGVGGDARCEPAESFRGGLCAHSSSTLCSRRISYSRASTACGTCSKFPWRAIFSRWEAASEAGSAAKFPTEPFNRWASRSRSCPCFLSTAQ